VWVLAPGIPEIIPLAADAAEAPQSWDLGRARRGSFLGQTKVADYSYSRTQRLGVISEHPTGHSCGSSHSEYKYDSSFTLYLSAPYYPWAGSRDTREECRYKIVEGLAMRLNRRAPSLRVLTFDVLLDLEHQLLICRAEATPLNQPGSSELGIGADIRDMVQWSPVMPHRSAA
jgi:hypothetical protein